MDAEELRQRHAARVGQVAPLPALDLREIRLADLAPELLLDRFDDRLLGHLAIGATEGTFDSSEVAEFFADGHIADCDINIAICDKFVKGGVRRLAAALECGSLLPKKKPRVSAGPARRQACALQGGSKLPHSC